MSALEANKVRVFGRTLVIFGAITFSCLSTLEVLRGPTRLLDFRTAFSSARCLIHDSNPYRPASLVEMDHREGGGRPSDTDNDRFVMSHNVYFPTEFIVTVPFALLPFELAQALWIGVTAGSFILASFLTYDLASIYSAELAGWLLCILLATSEQLILYGNPVGLALSLCIIAAWCFFREKYGKVGVLCLVASLALKPHDGGLIWLYFLLAGGLYRRRAVQTLAVLVSLSLPTIVWLTAVAPGWARDMRSNWAVFTAHGQAADPGPAAFMKHGTALITDLRSVFSVFRDDPHFYETATYLTCAPILLIWIVITLRTRPAKISTLLALAAIAPISMLPTYHRIYDAKLVMLTIPACALLRAEGSRRLGRLALIVTAAGCILSADPLWSLYVRALIQLHLLTPVEPGPLISSALNFPLPIMMLILGVFYLWLYWRHASGSPPLTSNPAHAGDASAARLR